MHKQASSADDDAGEIEFEASCWINIMNKQANYANDHAKKMEFGRGDNKHNGVGLVEIY